MKPGVSSLNPYAASYIPLSKREACDRTELATKASKRGNDNVWYAHPGHVAENQHHGKVSHDSIDQGAQKLPIPEGSALRSGVQHSSSQQMMNEEFEMNLEYLQMTFPGLSDQSLTDVYLANNHDLEATVDMLTQLESDTSESLPDTLDIGDVSESGAAMKFKTGVGETAASSSGSPGSAAIS